MAVTLPSEAVRQFPRFSLYNSPYPAHDAGCAVDLYPGERRDAVVPSPVAGEVLETRTVRCPPRPYAAEHDHLILVDAGDHVARLLHVDPGIAAGDRLAVGDPLGRTVRSGFFAPWVGDHVHLGFRAPDANLQRASGSLPLELDVDVRSVAWDGTGTVVATGETYAVLDAPGHPGGGYAAVAGDDGRPLDGGLVHYSGGGTFDGESGSVSLLGTTVGDADGRTVTWRDVGVWANDERMTGLSLFAGRDELGAKLVARDHDLSVGEAVRVRVEPTDDPVRLG